MPGKGSNELRRDNPLDPSNGSRHIFVLRHAAKIQRQVRNLAAPVAVIAESLIDRAAFFPSRLEVRCNREPENLRILQFGIRVFPKVPAYSEVREATLPLLPSRVDEPADFFELGRA